MPQTCTRLYHRSYFKRSMRCNSSGSIPRNFFSQRFIVLITEELFVFPPGCPPVGFGHPVPCGPPVGCDFPVACGSPASICFSPPPSGSDMKRERNCFRRANPGKRFKRDKRAMRFIRDKRGTLGTGMPNIFFCIVLFFFFFK